ncbi:MAG: hypothetical protein M3357_13290 [Actinomycetota bacterium]|nr:hypothetical protein [Actinomycetota bacterium]
MSVGRSAGSVRGDLSGDLGRVGAALEDMAEQQGQILERMERLVELNEQMWDHHLQFCGRLIETVTQTDVQLLEAQTELRRQLDALRNQGVVEEKPGD